MILDAKIPAGPMAQKWDDHRFAMKLVNPANKRKYKVLVVGTGLAGSAVEKRRDDGAGPGAAALCYAASRDTHEVREAKEIDS